jgi:hypothetical protein
MATRGTACHHNMLLLLVLLVLLLCFTAADCLSACVLSGP